MEAGRRACVERRKFFTHFGRPLAHFWWPLGSFWLCFGILGSQKLRVVPPSWRPRAAPKTLQKRNLDFSSIWGAVLVIFSRFLSILNKFRTPFRRYFHDFSSQNLPYQNGPNSHPQRSLDFFIALPANVNQFQVQKKVASTARISRCRRSPRTTIRRHRPVSGVSD